MMRNIYLHDQNSIFYMMKLIFSTFPVGLPPWGPGGGGHKRFLGCFWISNCVSSRTRGRKIIPLIFPNSLDTQETVNKKILMKKSKTRSTKLRSGGVGHSEFEVKSWIFQCLTRAKFWRNLPFKPLKIAQNDSTASRTHF